MMTLEDYYDFMQPHVLAPPTVEDLEIRSSERPRRPPKSRKCSASTSEAHIPRPRNPFILFRTITWHRLVQNGFGAETDHRHKSQISGFIWGKLTEEQMEPWTELGELEKERHARLYPNYKFKPVQRDRPRQKRVTRRNGPAEEARNVAFAELAYSGYTVPVLDTFIREFDKRSAAKAAADSPTTTARKTPSPRRKRASPYADARPPRSRKSAADRASSTESDGLLAHLPASLVATPVKRDPSPEWVIPFAEAASPVAQPTSDVMSSPLGPPLSPSPSPQSSPVPATPPSDAIAVQAVPNVAVNGQYDAGAHMLPSVPYYFPAADPLWVDFELAAAAYTCPTDVSFDIDSFGPFSNAVDPAASAVDNTDFGEYFNFDLLDSSAPSMDSASMLFRHSH